MEEKAYPKAELIEITTSTTLYCSGCHAHTVPYETVWQLGNVYYHGRCKPGGEATVKTVIVKDKLSVKSQGK